MVLRDELYGGSWGDLERDLTARKERKPFVFKLSTRIDEDLRRIARLRGYEERHDVDLRELLAGVGGPVGGPTTRAHPRTSPPRREP